MLFFLRPAAAVLNAVTSHLRHGPPAAADPSPRPQAKAAASAQPSVARAVPAKKGVQTLLCEVGQHEWTRAAAPGRKPKACPAHT